MHGARLAINSPRDPRNATAGCLDPSMVFYSATMQEVQNAANNQGVRDHRTHYRGRDTETTTNLGWARKYFFLAHNCAICDKSETTISGIRQIIVPLRLSGLSLGEA